MKEFWQSKTLWVSLATIFTGIGSFVSGEQNWQTVVITVLGAVFGILRLVTNKEIKL
jgi:hypothetical protein